MPIEAAHPQTTMDDLIATLSSRLGAGALLVDGQIGERYCVDFTGENPCRPIAVARPSSTRQLAEVMRLCFDAGQRVVVQGGMTGLSGGSTPQARELAISMERMTGVEAIDTASQTMTVMAGTPLEAVQEQADAAGFLFPLDLGARGSCTIGGNIATNAGGNEVIRYGMMRNLVLGLEAVLADGTVISSMNKMLKNNAGYDLKQLFIGTEGTLGIVTRAVLRLYPRLKSKSTALCALTSFDDTIALLHAMQADLGSSLSAYEVMWSSYFQYVVEHVDGLTAPFDQQYPYYALIEAAGADEVSDRAQFERALEHALTARLIEDAAIAQSEREAKAFWAIRDGIGDVTPDMHPAIVFDVSMPVGEIPRFIERIDTSFAATLGEVTNLPFGHIGDNNLHLIVTTGRERDVETIYNIVFEATGAHQGAVSAEHGIGALKRRYLKHSRLPAELALMRTLKTALDPKGILNHGRVLPD